MSDTSWDEEKQDAPAGRVVWQDKCWLEPQTLEPHTAVPRRAMGSAQEPRPAGLQVVGCRWPAASGTPPARVVSASNCGGAIRCNGKTREQPGFRGLVKEEFSGFALLSLGHEFWGFGASMPPP